MSLSTIILESGGVFTHNTNQDGSGNIGVNIENTPTVSISGGIPGPSDVAISDTGTFTASFDGTTQTNTAYRGVLIAVIVGAVSGTSPTMQVQPEYSPDAGATWFTFGNLIALTASNQQKFINIYPAATGLSGVTGTNAALPKTWRLSYTITGATPSFVISNVFASYLL